MSHCESTHKTMPPNLSCLLRSIRQAGATLYRDGGQIYIEGGSPELQALVAANQDALRTAVLPAVTDDQAALVRELLADLTIRYITDSATATEMVRTLLADASKTGVLGIDTETMVRPEYRTPIPITLTQSGTVATRQPTDGVAGYALDPRRAEIRLLQVYGGGDTVAVFDMQNVRWTTVASLFHTAPAAALFNAVFDLRMLIAAGVEPTVGLYDVMTAMRLVDGTRPSLGEATRALLGISIPKTLGASDWSGDLSPTQLDYAALDAVLTFELWQAQRDAFEEADENAQDIADGCLIAVARMEMAGMPVNAERHARMIGEWEAHLAEAQQELRRVSGGRLRGNPTNAEVVAYLENILDDVAYDAWPSTPRSGALAVNKSAFATHGQNVTAIPELLNERAWTKALSTYGAGLAARVEPDTGRIYAGFLVAGARTGRFSSRAPNLQNLPKRSRRLKDFRRIFVSKMTRAWLEFHPDAPYRGIVEVGVGRTWADAH